MKIVAMTAFAAVAVLALPAHAQDLPVLAHGTLTDANGQPTAGHVRVFVNPVVTGRSRGHMTPLSETDAGPDGRWEARGALNADARRAIAQGDGVVNLLVLARTAGGEVVMPAPQPLAGDPVANAASGPPPDYDIDVSVPAEAAQAPAAPRATAAQHRADCDYVFGPEKINRTRIGELHQSKLIDAKFTYGEDHQADTDFSGAISYGGNWIARGGYHVTRSRSMSDTFNPPKGKFSRYLITRFSYRKLSLKGRDCGRKETIIVPKEWRGGSDWKTYDDAPSILDGACANVGDEYNHPISPGGEFATGSANAAKISVGVEVFGASLTTQSGYSKHAFGTWHTSARARTTQYVCGNGQDPADAPVVYAG